MNDTDRDLNYDPSDPDKMRLPAGARCSQCKHIKRCNRLFGRVGSESYCDWSPSRFVRAAASMADPIQSQGT